MQATDIIILTKHMQILNNMDHILYLSVSTLSLPFLIYIVFKIGKIAQQFIDLNKRVDVLEKFMKHLSINQKKDN